MKNLKAKRLGSILILCLSLAFMACQDTQDNQPSAKVQLGAIFSLSGIKADLGIPSAKGAQLAVAQLNETGGVLGREVELLLKDGESDTAIVQEKVAEILQEAPETVALFGLSDTDLARSAAREARRGNRVFLTSGATSPLLPAQVPDYLYMACFGDNVQAAAAAEWAYNELDARTVAVVYDSLETYTILLHQYFIDRFQSLGGQVVGIQAYDPADMTRIGQEMPAADFVFLSAESPEAAVQGIQVIRKAGITTPIVGGDGYDSEDVWEAHPEIKDVYYATHVYLGADNTNELVSNFREAYSSTFGGNLPGAFAALSYDAVNLLAMAITQAGTTDPDTVRQALATINNFQGVTGTISFAGGQQIPRKSVSIIEVKEGTRTFQQQLMPDVIPNP